jgi:hypothetical protein
MSVDEGESGEDLDRGGGDVVSRHTWRRSGCAACTQRWSVIRLRGPNDGQEGGRRGPNNGGGGAVLRCTQRRSKCVA